MVCLVTGRHLVCLAISYGNIFLRFLFNKEGKYMKKALITLVRGYQKGISPLFPPSCRYYPTCSSYMIKAIEVHGAIKGVAMGSARIARCHPFVQGGLDYVPEQFSLGRNRVDKVEPKYEKREGNE